MENCKQMLTEKEEEALIAIIAKYGTGKWKLIQRDPEFKPRLSSRCNIDLKDRSRLDAKSNTGKWKLIQRDPEFNPRLSSRCNIDLKDRLRLDAKSDTGTGVAPLLFNSQTSADADADAASRAIAARLLEFCEKENKSLCGI